MHSSAPYICKLRTQGTCLSYGYELVAKNHQRNQLLAKYTAMSSDASVLPDIDYPLIVLVSLKSLYHLLYDKIDGRHFTLKHENRSKERVENGTVYIPQHFTRARRCYLLSR